MALRDEFPVRFFGGPLDGATGNVMAQVGSETVLLPISVTMRLGKRIVEYRLVSREMPTPVYTFVGYISVRSPG